MREVIEEMIPEFDGYVMRPKDASGIPGVVLLHAYNQRPRDLHVYARKFAENNLLAFVPRYTDLSDGVQIAVKALRALKSHHLVDKNRTGIFGISLGGTVALLAATQEPVEFVVDVGGWVDLADLYRYLSKFPSGTPQKIIADTVESTIGTPEESPEVYRLSSPITYVDYIKSKKILIIHGEKDDMVPLDQSKLLLRKLQENGAMVKLEVIEGAGYLLKGFEDRVVDTVLRFLREISII